MGIHEEVERLLSERSRAATGIGREAAAQAEGARRARARIEAREQELLPIGRTFVRWAKASRIKPIALAHRGQNLLFYVRSVPTEVGWPLQTNFAVTNEDRGGYGGNKQVLAVLRSGVIKWFNKGTIVSRAEAESAIAIYVADALVRFPGRTVPWPADGSDVARTQSRDGGAFGPDGWYQSM